MMTLVRTRVITTPPIYRCPYCGERFYNFFGLFIHCRHKHDTVLLTPRQYRVLLACRRLRDRGKTWFTCAEVYQTFREMFDDIRRGAGLRNMIRQNLHSLARKRILEMRRKHDILMFKLRE